MKKHLAILFLSACAVILAIPAGAVAQADSTAVEITSRLVLNYLCKPDSVILTATLDIRKGDENPALENAAVEFAASSGDTRQVLGTAKSNQEGIARLAVPAGSLPASRDGVLNYSATFAGSSTYPSAEGSFSAKPAILRLSFSVEDSIRVLQVTATQKNEKGGETPIPNETVLIYVPRLFSLLKVGEITLGEDGTGTFEFPGGIVGDTLGNLTVVARIEEHDLFGFAQGQNDINWGVHKQFFKAEAPSRELWTPIAPLWMIIALIIMLAGVWAHYFYAVYELVMIKRLSKKDKQLF